jgi:hypothetical protein
MWICFNEAFLSIVAHRDNDALLMVRARREGDIERVFPSALVRRTPDGDYLYRASVTRDVVARTLVQRATDIDYDNFKNSVADDDLHDAYERVWGVMRGLQRWEALRDHAT